MNNMKELLRQLPKIDEVLKDQRLFVFFEEMQRELIVEASREEIEALRKRILDEEIQEACDLSGDKLIERILVRIQEKKRRSLRQVINATGTIVHTNLGRARLSSAACRSVEEAAVHYSTLEYDVAKGARGSRHDHIEKVITRITKAEAAMAVNNNAAAVLLCLSALAKDKEVIVSRGELVEIGGSFRIPDIMELGGAKLREVGTTNKTKISDYRDAIEEGRTGMLLKVHTSNYKIVGFTAEASIEELSTLGKAAGIPVIHDIGSGLMLDLTEYGVDEPTVQQSLEAGADLVLFSGDKLLGGPQAGIVAGRKDLIDRMKRHPLARAVRLDKMTLAALEATFREYIDPVAAKSSIPVLAMITASREMLKDKADRLAAMIVEKTDAYNIRIEKTEGQIGGGSTPNQFLDGFALSIESNKISVEQMERSLRNNEPPIIARINHNRLLIDLRTVDEEELLAVATAFARMVRDRRPTHA